MKPNFNLRRCCLILAFSISLLTVACNRENAELPAAADMVKVDWLLYEDLDAGAGQYPVRILVSDRYLRFDDNYDDSDFLLLDRRTRGLYSVNHEERSILDIDSKAGDLNLPPEILLTEERTIDAEAPKIDGISTVHIRFMANNDLCYEAFVLPGVQEKVTTALTEYFHIIGLQQLRSLDTVPVTMQTPCFLSRYVYRPARHLVEGLPVREWDADGYMRTLVDYRDQQMVSRNLFMLPDGYTHTRID